ncbi:MAG: phenylalanine--tRNA ligase beta subunit-related protein [Planctomycetota bacterium]|nr:phenylalanine--tRNA ligase beta subunit-related protein [Planctomycetota bacterium]
MAAAFEIEISPSLALLCPAFTLEGLIVRAESAELQAAIASLCAELRAKFRDMKISDVPGVQPVRGTYRALGLDPTRYRPSSEALLHRVLRGQDLYRINTLVDALNLCSLRYLVPFGLYDVEALHPPVVLRVGQPGEGYPGIRKELVNVAGRYCLADARGPFGNPSSDSDRTKITLSTRRALVVAFLPADTPAEHVRRIVDGTAETLVRYSAS